MIFAGFDSLQALSPSQCRPFDAGRDGLILGEGAAALILEPLEEAQRRGAHILAELVGYGAATDRHHLTQPHPAGDAAVASMSEACRRAGVGPDAIDYLNAHGTGTVLNDAAEAAAARRGLGGVRLETAAQNAAAQKFFERLGYDAYSVRMKKDL